MITDVPEAIPVTTPLVVPIEAIDVLPLVHVPPVMASLNVVVFPTQTEVAPVIGAVGLTTTVLVAEVASPQASVAVTV